MIDIKEERNVASRIKICSEPCNGGVTTSYAMVI